MGGFLHRAASASTMALALLTAGCATRLDVAPHGPAAPSGITYALPYTQYTVTITRRLLACDGVNIRAGVKVEIVEGAADDPANIYVIDPTSLSHAWNTASLKVEFHENSNWLKSINAEVQDQVAPALTNLISGVGKLFAFQTGLGGGPGAQACRADIREIPAQAETQTKLVQDLTAALERQTALVARLRARRVELGDAVDAVTVRDLNNALNLLEAKTTELAEEQRVLTRLLNAITVVELVRWPENSVDRATTTPYRLPDNIVSRWFGTLNDENRAKFDVHLALESNTVFASRPLAPGQTAETPDGIRYRVPVAGRVVACATAPCSSRQPANVLAQLDGQIAQLGFVQTLSIRARPLENVSFSATFTRNGALASAGYTRSGAPAVAAPQLLTTLAEQMQAVETARNGREQRELSENLTRLQTMVQIQTAQQALAPSPTAAVVADTALRNAEAQRIQADVNVMNAENAILLAEIARLQAQQQRATFGGN